MRAKGRAPAARPFLQARPSFGMETLLSLARDLACCVVIALI